VLSCPSNVSASVPPPPEVESAAATHLVPSYFNPSPALAPDKSTSVTASIVVAQPPPPPSNPLLSVRSLTSAGIVGLFVKSV